jgi:hypothetical protein
VIELGQIRVHLADLTRGRIPPPHVPGMAVEPVFYFPSWSCGMAEPRTQLLMHSPDCKPHIVWTVVEKIGALVSALSVLLLVGLATRNYARPLPAPNAGLAIL